MDDGVAASSNVVAESFITVGDRDYVHHAGNINVLPTDLHDSIFAFMRINGNNKVLVILNLSNKDKLQFKLAHPLLEGDFTHLFSGITYKLGVVQTFELQAWEYVVLVQ